MQAIFISGQIGVYKWYFAFRDFTFNFLTKRMYLVSVMWGGLTDDVRYCHIKVVV